MARAGSTPSKKAAPTARRDRLRGDALDVWVTYQLAGATVAAAQHESSRRNVYRHVDRVEADASLLAEARARLDERRKSRDERTERLVDAAREALLARIVEGKVSTKYLTGLVMPEAAPARGATTTALQVPQFMATPRVDAPAAAPSAPTSSEAL